MSFKAARYPLTEWLLIYVPVKNTNIYYYIIIIMLIIW